MEQRKLRIGQKVVYHDPRSRAHDALITAIHGGTPVEPPAEAFTTPDENGKFATEASTVLVPVAGWIPCVNLLWVSSDPKRQDSYGRQTERESSVVHATSSGVHGAYWRFDDEEPNPVVQSVT